MQRIIRRLLEAVCTTCKKCLRKPWGSTSGASRIFGVFSQSTNFFLGLCYSPFRWRIQALGYCGKIFPERFSVPYFCIRSLFQFKISTQTWISVGANYDRFNSGYSPYPPSRMTEPKFRHYVCLYYNRRECRRNSCDFPHCCGHCDMSDHKAHMCPTLRSNGSNYNNGGGYSTNNNQGGFSCQHLYASIYFSHTFFSRLFVVWL